MKYIKLHEDFDFDDDDFDFEEEDENEIKVGDRVIITDKIYTNYDWSTYKIYKNAVKRKTIHKVVRIGTEGNDPEFNVVHFNDKVSRAFYVPMDAVILVKDDLFENFDFNDDDFDFEEEDKTNVKIKDLKSLSRIYMELKSIIREKFKIVLYLHHVHKSLRSIGLDELDEIELIMEIENVFNISLPDEKIDIDGLTARNLIRLINEIINGMNENFDFNDDDFDFEEENEHDSSEIIDFLINKNLNVLFLNKDKKDVVNFLKNNNVVWRDTGRGNFDFWGGIKLIKFGKFSKHSVHRKLKNLEGQYYIEIGNWNNMCIKFDKLFDIDIEKNIIR